MYRVTLFILLLHAIIKSSQGQYQVTTNYGDVIGSLSTYEVNGSHIPVIEYLGIPYAKPPIGDRRFKPPDTVESWEEPIEANSYKPACPQDSDLLWDILNGSSTTYENFTSGNYEIDEDCLFLNIYQPNRTESEAGNAVMVYFHGGDFVSGSGMAYAGNVLSSRHEVVVVTVNYRLGALGFLSDGSSEMPGNYGLMDQQMALKWIKENIQNFGGDPDLVTIFGSAAGGSSVHLHTIINGSSEYFQRAIVQSATYNDDVWNKNTARGHYNALLQNLDSDTESAVTKLRNESWDVIQAALPGPWRPVISDMIPFEPREAMMNGDANNGKDILVGSNNLDAYQIVVADVDIEQPDWYRDAVRDVTNATSEFNSWTNEDVEKRMLMFNQFYVGFGNDIEFFPAPFPNTMIARIYTDQLYGTWAQEVAMTSSVCSCHAYKYVFKQRPPNSELGESWPLQGAALGDELPYIFGFMTAQGRDNVTQQDIELSTDVMRMWTEFAKTGHLPANDSLVSFETFSAYSDSGSCRSTVFIEIGGAVALPDLPTSRNWEFWNSYYDTLGFSCSEETSSPEIQVSGGEENDEDNEQCEAGVWSDAGVEMSNETAGALLILFIVLTAFFMLAFSLSCHKWNKAKRKIRKILDDGGSSVISNSSTKM